MNQSFEFERLDFDGAYLIKPFVAYDERGFFLKDFSEQVFKEAGITDVVKEVFATSSKKGVLRGIHFQRVYGQAKIVRCISGRIFDVMVDLRKGSPTFGQWRGFELSEENKNVLLIPEFFGHAYLVIEPAVVLYMGSENYYSEYDDGVVYSDPDIGIDWPLGLLDVPLIVSEKDGSLHPLSEVVKRL